MQFQSVISSFHALELPPALHTAARMRHHTLLTTEKPLPFMSANVAAGRWSLSPLQTASSRKLTPKNIHLLGIPCCWPVPQHGHFGQIGGYCLTVKDVPQKFPFEERTFFRVHARKITSLSSSVWPTKRS